MSEPLLIASDLEKSYSERSGIAHTIGRRLWRLGRPPERVPVFEKLSFELRRGECIALTGPNGCGKSTLLRCLAGVVAFSGGRLRRHGRMSALLSHGFGAYEDLPVHQNITLVLQLLGAGLAEARSGLEPVAELAGLRDRLHSPSSHLSEGMRAKIALASLSRLRFDLALLDESLNHVDTEFRNLFFGLTRNWIAEGRSLLITSHDEQLLERFPTRRLRFQNRTLSEL